MSLLWAVLIFILAFFLLNLVLPAGWAVIVALVLAVLVFGGHGRYL